MTGGSASGFRGNYKSHGESFSPRSDVQVIILSSTSPYEVYGSWQSKLQRRYMSREVLQQLEQRFHIYRLDGSLEEDRIEFMFPKDWTEEQLKRQIGDVLKPLADKGINEVNKSLSQKIIVLSQYIISVKKLLDAKYKDIDCSLISCDALSHTLTAWSSVLPSNFPLSWEELVNHLYIVETCQMKVGMNLTRAIQALETLVEDKNRELVGKRSDSFRAEKLVNYKDVSKIYDMAYQDCTDGIIKKEATKRGWREMGRCFYEPTFFQNMTIEDVVNYVTYKPNAIRHLANFYGMEYTDVETCMAMHSPMCYKNDSVMETYKFKVFQPICCYRQKQVERKNAWLKDVWSDDEDDAHDDDVEENIDKLCTKKAKKSNVFLIHFNYKLELR